jgi:hypothetical protein
METYSRIAITSVIIFLVISLPIFVFCNPVQVFAADNTNRIDSSGIHSTPSVPATSGSTSPTPMVPAATNQGNDGDFSAQAALSLTRAAQTSNFVASKAYYDISFRTATAGAIKTITMDFPTGTSVGSALVVEVVGLGPGTLAASAGEVLTYTVTNAVNVPALTNIRIQISNINNPPTPSGSFTVSITTRNAANAIIDGPTPTSAYNMVQVGNAQIAPGAVTTTKIATGAVSSTDVAESFMKRVTVRDTPNGHTVGWNPDGATITFIISEPLVEDFDSVFFIIEVESSANHFCDVTSHISNTFTIDCSSPPANADILNYVVGNLPPHVIG